MESQYLAKNYREIQAIPGRILRKKSKSPLDAGFFNKSIGSRQFDRLGQDAFGVVERLAYRPINVVATSYRLAADWTNR